MLRKHLKIMTNNPPLIAHVIYRLDIGGLENGLVNLINRIPEDHYRHVILCLKGYSDFRDRIHRKDVEIIDLKKRDGNDLRLYYRLWQHFTALKPDIVHTRNLATLEAVIPAIFSGVRVRIHSEHGREFDDIDGNSRKNRLLRRALMPVVSHAIALSRDLESYMNTRIGVQKRKLTQIYNGVETEKFYPSGEKNNTLPFSESGLIVFGTVGRMQAVKDQTTLVRAFIRLLEVAPELRETVRLIIVGDGPLKSEALSLLEKACCADITWLPGARNDVADIMRQMDIFVLPSLSEGISNTILEAMATGLPVIATQVGGNDELVMNDETGMLVPPADPEAMARCMLRYLADRSLIIRHGNAAKQSVVKHFSMDAMVRAYLKVYDSSHHKGMTNMTGN